MAMARLEQVLKILCYGKYTLKCSIGYYKEMVRIFYGHGKRFAAALISTEMVGFFKLNFNTL